MCYAATSACHTTPSRGRSHRTELVTTTTRPAEPPASSIEEQVHQRLRQNDREVNQTIVRIITAHLRPEAPTKWSGHNYDFTGVLFADASLGGATFSGKNTRLDKATFSGESVALKSPRASKNVTFDWDYPARG